MDLSKYEAEENLNAIIKLNFKNTKNFRIEPTDTLANIAQDNLNDHTFESNLRIEALEQEL